MLLKWVINLDNRNLQYSAFQFPVNRLPNIPSTLSFGENGQGKQLRTKLYGGSGTTSSAKTRQFYQIVVVRLNRPLHILEYSSRFPYFSQLTFLINSTFPQATNTNSVLTPHSVYCVRSVFGHYSRVSKSTLWSLLNAVSRINFSHMYWLQSLTKHIFQIVLTVVTKIVCTLC